MAYVKTTQKKGRKIWKRTGKKNEFQKKGYSFLKHNKITYAQYLQSGHWKAKSTDYKTRFPLCETCRKNKSTQVHHKSYANLGNEQYWDLISICEPCHKEKHNLL